MRQSPAAKKRRFSLGVLFAASIGGCGDDIAPATDTGEVAPVRGPDFEVRYQTKHVDIAPGFSQPVCRGTLEEVDRHVEAVSTLLGIEPARRATWFWFNENAEGTRVDLDRCEWCSNCVGCARGASAVLYADWRIVYHELVHAVVVASLGSSDIVFEEGIAIGLDINGAVGPNSAFGMWPDSPSEVAGGPKHGGAHFSRWLIDRFGAAKFRELFEPRLGKSSTKQEVFDAVQEVYGTPMLELEEEYFATAALVYPYPGLCDGLMDVPWDGTTWELSTTTDCDAPHVFGPADDGGMWISVTLDVPDIGGEDFRMSGMNTGAGTMEPCYDEPVYDEAEIRGNTVASASIVGSIEPGRYRLLLPVKEPGDVVLRIEPWG